MRPLTSRALMLAMTLLLVGAELSTDLALAQQPDCHVAQSAIEASSRIRQLRIKRTVPCTIEDREQVKKFLINAVQNKIPAEKMRFDELIAKALGFIPDDYDYKNGLINLYLSQLGGYYEPEKKRYVMAGWLPEIMQPVVAVHELTHALQDQHYDLETFIDDVHFPTDQLLARAALVEGDATAVMLDYQRSLLSQSPIAQEEKVDSFVLQTVLGMAMATSNERVPESLKASLLFPYASGIRFVHSLLRKGGYREVDRAFAAPADSTEEILHPEKFKSGKSEYMIPADSEFDQVLNGKPILYRDTLGEFSIAALFSGGEINRERAALAAAGWGGDRVVAFGEPGHESVVWVTNWDSERDAKEFFAAYREFATARGTDVQQGSGDAIRVKVDAHLIAISLQGSRVTVSVTG